MRTLVRTLVLFLFAWAAPIVPAQEIAGVFDDACAPVEQHGAALAMSGRLAAGGDDATLAAMADNVALSPRASGRAQEALWRIEAALARRRRVYGDRDHSEVAQAMNDLACCLSSLGRDGEALPLHQAALAMRQRIAGGQAHPDVAQSLSYVGTTLLQLLRPQQALPKLEEGLAMRRILYGDADHPDLAENLNNLGVCLQGLGRRPEALAHYRATLAMQQRLCGNGDHPRIASTHNNIALCLEQLGRPAEAVPSYEAALAMFRRLYADRDHPDLARLQDNMASCLYDLGCTEEGLALAGQSVHMVERLWTASRSLSPELQQSFFDELGRHGVFERLQGMQVASGRPHDALTTAERSRGRQLLDLMEQQSSEPLDEAERRARLRGDAPTAARIVELRRQLRRTDAEDNHLLHALGRSTRDAEPAAAPEPPVDELRERMRTLSTQRRELFDERARLIADVLPVGRPRTVAEIQAALQQDECLLVFSTDDTGALLYVVPPTGGAITAHAAPLAHFARPLANWLARISRAPVQERRGRDAPAAATDSGHRDARTLFDALIPAAVWQQIQGRQRVFVAAHGALHRLPLETLVVGEQDGHPVHWFDVGPAIAYVPSGSALHWLRMRRQGQDDDATALDLLAVGNPRNDESELLPGLRGAEAEVQAIAKTFGDAPRVRTLLGAEAQEDAVRELAATARLVHFACHGIAEEADQSLSMLVLAQPATLVADQVDDGFLKLHDLLHHWRGRLGSTQLVVLSACRTNVGPQLRDDAPQVLPLGFLFAGASSVISSLWAADDASTAALMADFYRRLAAGETDRLAAFTAARRQLRAEYPAPFHWAPFLYIGSPE